MGSLRKPVRACRQQLLETATRADPESVVGDECHVVSGKAFGPRYDASFPIEELDEPENRGQRRQYGNGLFGRWPDKAYFWVASFHEPPGFNLTLLFLWIAFVLHLFTGMTIVSLAKLS